MLFNEVVQHLPVVNHAPCVVRSHFVHGLLVGQLYTLGGVGVNASLDAALLLLGNKSLNARYSWGASSCIRWVISCPTIAMTGLGLFRSTNSSR